MDLVILVNLMEQILSTLETHFELEKHSLGLPASESGRVCPRPKRSWTMRMKWHDLLFMHWPVETDAIRHLIPSSLELDTFDGMAWLGIVPFRMTGVAPRFVPNVPFISNLVSP